MKSKYLAFGLSALLVLSLVSCGGQQAQEPQEPKQEVQQAEPISTQPVVAPEEVKREIVTTAPETEPEELSGDALINYFQTVYEGYKEFVSEYTSSTEEAIQIELGVIEAMVRDDGKVLPADYEVQYRAWRPVEEAPVQLFNDCNETVWATGTVNLRSGPSTSHDKVGSLNKSDSVTRTGIGINDADGWSRVQLSDGSTVYVSNNYLSTTKPAVQSTGTTQTSKPSGGGSQTQTQQPQQTKPGSTSSSGSFDPYEGYGSYEAYLDAKCKKFPNKTREELSSIFPDLNKTTVDRENVNALKEQGRLTSG